MGLMVNSARAEFTLNFQPKGSGTFTTSATHSGLSQDNGTQTGQTNYLMGTSLERPEIVTDPDNGNTYYHMIVGDLATGFIQETYIQMGYGNYGATALGEPADSASASGGVSSFDRTTVLGTGYDPLDANKNSMAQAVISGNGTANPNRVIMRQIVSDGEVMMEYLKDKYANKARISQMMVATDITANFDLDMRNSTFADASTVGIITNTMQLWGQGVPYDSSVFDMAKDAPNAVVNGGKYTYTTGSGFGGSEGTYNYSDGGFDQTAVDWASYMDPMLSNPWSFSSAK
jgi:hypothetical protein